MRKDIPKNRFRLKYTDQGKLPPQAIDLEEAVLGALMLEKDAIFEVIDVITEKSFYKESNQKIYKAILKLNDASKPIDVLTVINQLKSNGELDIIGGAYHITQLTNKPSSAANIEYHARIVEEKHIARDVIRISSELITEAYDETSDVFNITEKMITEAYNLGDVGQGTAQLSNTEILRELKEKIQNAKLVKGITGLRTGILTQDQVFGGYQNTDLYIKAGRPAMGKTGLALTEAAFMAFEEDKKVLFFSLEMSSAQLMERLVAIQTGISINKFKSGELTTEDWKHYNKITSEMMGENLKIIDIPGLPLNSLIKIAKKHKLKYGLDALYVDYLQLMTNSMYGSNREQEISSISRGLKGVAKDLNIPVIALAQLSRAVETRGGDKRPQLSDLRESGAIEQDADSVQFVYRPEYYGLTEDEEGMSTLGRADLIIAKNRHGAIKTIHTRFTPHLTKFEDITAEPFSHQEYKTGLPDMPIGKDFDSDKPKDLPF